MKFSGAGFFMVIFGIAWIIYAILWTTATTHAYQNCDGGHVLKNQFDWPVCVR